MQLTRFSVMDGEVMVRPVIARVSSVSQHHVYVLDGDNKLFLFAGRSSAPAELLAAEQLVKMILAESDTRALSVVRVGGDDKRAAEQFFELLGGDASLVSKESVQLVAPPHLSVFQESLQYPRPSLFSFASLPEAGCAVASRSKRCFRRGSRGIPPLWLMSMRLVWARGFVTMKPA